MQKKIFNPFQLTEDNEYMPCFDTEPDICYYYVQSNCSYCPEDSFNDFFIQFLKLWILFIWIYVVCPLIWINQFLSNLDTRFDIIGITETRLNESNKDIYDFGGYNHVPLVSPDRIHGGISVCISADLFYQTLPEISMTNGDTEFLFVDVELSAKEVNAVVL